MQPLITSTIHCNMQLLDNVKVAIDIMFQYMPWPSMLHLTLLCITGKYYLKGWLHHTISWLNSQHFLFIEPSLGVPQYLVPYVAGNFKTNFSETWSPKTFWKIKFWKFREQALKQCKIWTHNNTEYCRSETITILSSKYFQLYSNSMHVFSTVDIC